MGAAFGQKPLGPVLHLYRSQLHPQHRQITYTKPSSKNLEPHFSVESQAFGGSALKKSSSVASTGSKRMIPLGTGRPSPEYYPWIRSLESKQFDTYSEAITKETNPPAANGHHQLALQVSTKHDDGYNLALALNYGHAHVELVHNPSYSNWDTCLTAGTTSALEIAFRIFCNRGDIVLSEKYTYPGTIKAINLVGAQMQAVDLDKAGASAIYLKEILDKWDISRGPKPTVFYTIPCGQNPTDTTQSLKRRQQILEVAEEHVLIIIEDDPYYFLRPGLCSTGADSDISADGVPSYLFLDTFGRVVRLDSTSKILAPGLRAGWVTANASIIEKFLAYQEVSTVAVSEPVQMMLYILLDDNWGHTGFFSWLDFLSQQYRIRRDLMLEACSKYLPQDICTWVPPDYGMFLWLELDWRKHPQFKDGLSCGSLSLNLLEIENNILQLALEDGVQVTKGSLFRCSKKPIEELHFRMTFAAASEQDLTQGVRIFAGSIRKEFTIY
ncbi:L-kynurenine/alpha-aminoadipate aminotransferase [Penicillium malachiteum]|uniref:L-kynurenine/alpha-aminoadipate aminotransferase n=1 Tax=Penicillium malachiteum TaxID=1324776 RepID=UPI0025486176|nr:L-kynurenine/alpha-aminoadipate aminotransferase [Penicillium malachiteum]KAJ5729133.1 L-kynurenine/alpha-aminoadipate aminotransferase [Penicillium malachiteum]